MKLNPLLLLTLLSAKPVTSEINPSNSTQLITPENITNCNLDKTNFTQQDSINFLKCEQELSGQQFLIHNSITAFCIQASIHRTDLDSYQDKPSSCSEENFLQEIQDKCIERTANLNNKFPEYGITTLENQEIVNFCDTKRFDTSEGSSNVDKKLLTSLLVSATAVFALLGIAFKLHTQSIQRNNEDRNHDGRTVVYDFSDSGSFSDRSSGGDVELQATEVTR